MAYLLLIANQKGGCGKTTTAMNVCGGLTRASYSTCVIDADPQASATIWSLAQGQGSLPFDVIPARQLRWRVDALRSRSEDVVVVDCPPGVAGASDEAVRFTRALLREADAIVVPLRPSTLDFSAAASFVRFLGQQRQATTKVGVLINGRQNTVLGKQARDQATVLFAPIAGAVVFETTIGLRAPITEVSGSGKTIFDYAPRHTAATEYVELTKEIILWLSNAPHSPLTTSQTSTSHSPLPETN